MLPIHSQRADGFFYGVWARVQSTLGRTTPTEADALSGTWALLSLGSLFTLAVDGVLHDFAHHGRAGVDPGLQARLIWQPKSLWIMPVKICHCLTLFGVGHRHVIDDFRANYQERVLIIAELATSKHLRLACFGKHG